MSTLKQTKRPSSVASKTESPPLSMESMGGMDDSSSRNNTQWNRTGTTPTNLTGSTHTSQAWTQRERRRKRLKRKAARAKHLRMICGLGIGLTALILVVVHVEVSMLMTANNAKQRVSLLGGLNNNNKQQQPQQLQQRMEQQSSPRRILTSEQLNQKAPPPRGGDEAATPFPQRKNQQQKQNQNEEHDAKIGFHPNNNMQEHYAGFKKYAHMNVLLNRPEHAQTAHPHPKGDVPNNNSQYGGASSSSKVKGATKSGPKVIHHDSKKLSSKNAHDHKHRKTLPPGQQHNNGGMPKVIHHDSKKLTSKQAHDHQHKKGQQEVVPAPMEADSKAKAEAATQQEEIEKLQKDIEMLELKKGIEKLRQQQLENHAAANDNKKIEEEGDQPMEEGAAKVESETKAEEEKPNLIKAVIDAPKEENAASPNGPITANFCGDTPSADAGRTTVPAVIILGMEDTSTDLLWHVLRGITPEGWIHEPTGIQPARKPDYDVLNQMDPGKEDKFFKRMAIGNHIKWIPDSLCLQQQHAAVFKKPTLLGFPWLTVGDVAMHTRAVEALRSIKQLPPGSVKIIRYRRNVVDMVFRQEHYAKNNNSTPPVGDPFRVKQQQKALDDLLEKEGIAHITIDHERMFPFHSWKEMMDVTNQVESFPLAINDAKTDHSKVPPRQSGLEHEWEPLLRFMENTNPTSLHDIFAAAKDFDQRDGVFWAKAHPKPTVEESKPEAKPNVEEKKPEAAVPVVQEKRNLDETNDGDKQEMTNEEKAKQNAKEMLAKARAGEIHLAPLEIKMFENASGEKFHQEEVITKEEAEQNPKLVQAVNHAIQKAEAMPKPISANFCGNPSLPTGPKPTSPAIIILGMEDTSTDLFWHVLRAITPEGWIQDPVGLQPPKQPNYEALNQMDPSKEEKFFKDLPISNHGKWIRESFCLQQQHAQVFKKPTLLGFPWLTTGDIATRTRAIEALRTIKKLPPGSVKVIRYRRNILDMVSRQEQHLRELKEHQWPGAVPLDPKNLLGQLTKWTKQQKTMDALLENEGIPHITVDHENLFPFNAWKEMLNITDQLESFPLPLNVHIDYAHVPPDLRPPPQSELEDKWESVLQFMENNNPTSLYDIFASAKDFSRRDGVFWKQQKSIKNYPKIQQVLTGTHFQALLRNLEYKHDYFGCACNDKEANKLKMFKGWKKGVSKANQ